MGSIRPSRYTYPAMPINRKTVAAAKAHAKECVAEAMDPVTIGAWMAENSFPKLSMPPSVPTLPAGAISEGMDQHTGAAAASPPSEMLIQKIAEIGACRAPAPKKRTPKEVPAPKTVWRTREESKPRWINS